jgi:3'-5' exoribonuclease
VDELFVLSEKSLAQKKDGNNYLTVTVSDKTGTMKGVVWDRVDQIQETVSTGDVIRIQGVINEYKGNLQFVIKKMTPCSPESIRPGDFLPVTEHNVDTMFERLRRRIDDIEDEDLKALMIAFFDDAEWVESFKTAPAAKKMHHAYIGGLLEHTLSMALLVERIAGHYSGINMDLLLAGVVLHDIGKIREFDYTLSIDYSDEGRLLSHIVIGIQMVDEKLRGLKDFPEKKAFLLKHMIISHHGTRDFGSPEPPKTLEAVLLNYIDEIDSKVNGIRDFMAADDPAANWTSYHRVFDRFFYKGKTE